MPVPPPVVAAGRPATLPAGPPAPDAVPVRGRSRDGGAFRGTYRLERCVSLSGQLAAVGVFCGERWDAAGAWLGPCVQHATVAVEATSTGTALRVQVGPVDVSLAGRLVSVDELCVDVRGTSCAPAVRAALLRGARPTVGRRGRVPGRAR